MRMSGSPVPNQNGLPRPAIEYGAHGSLSVTIRLLLTACNTIREVCLQAPARQDELVMANYAICDR